MFKAFCNVHFCMILYVMTYYTSSCLVTKLWIHGMYICMYVCISYKITEVHLLISILCSAACYCVQVVLVLCDFFLRNFTLMQLENLHNFSNLCDNFQFNAIWLDDPWSLLSSVAG
jgi:hypothetical protein